MSQRTQKPTQRRKPVYQSPYPKAMIASLGALARTASAPLTQYPSPLTIGY